MRIDSRFAPASPKATSTSRGAAGQRFSLDGAGQGAKAPSVASAVPLGSLDALLAVQGEENPAERRRRTVKRGNDLLDTLDQLKAAVLSGRIGAAQLQRLATQLGGQGQSSGDPQLDELIAHIELRAQVELAKLGRA